MKQTLSPQRVILDRLQQNRDPASITNVHNLLGGFGPCPHLNPPLSLSIESTLLKLKKLIKACPTCRKPFIRNLKFSATSNARETLYKVLSSWIPDNSSKWATCMH